MGLKRQLETNKKENKTEKPFPPDLLPAHLVTPDFVIDECRRLVW